MTLRGGVGDILSCVLPVDFEAAVLHKPDEVLTVTGKGHALVDVDFQIQFPALPLIVGTVLPVGHGVFLLLLLPGLHNRKAVLQTQFVRRFHELCQAFLVAVIFLPGVTAYGVDDKMGVNVIPVRMGGNHNFKAGNLLRQLQSNLMGHLRGDRIVGMERLNHVVVHPSLGAVVLLLGVHELLESALWHTVDACDQRSALIIYLRFLAAVAENTTQTTYRLGAPVLYEVNDCHSVTALLSECQTVKNSPAHTRW